MYDITNLYISAGISLSQKIYGAFNKWRAEDNDLVEVIQLLFNNIHLEAHWLMSFSV